MRHVRMLAACLIAAFAIAAVAASGASAGGPEWGQCFEKSGGKYSDANCQTKAKKGTGSFEWRKGTEVANPSFHGGAGTGVLSTLLRVCSNAKRNPEGCQPPNEVNQEGVAEVECTSEDNFGETSGKKGVVNVSVRFHNCLLFGSVPCSNTPNEGEIAVNPLKGELGYINKAAKEVGVRLTPEKKKGEFAKFSCGGILSIVVGVGNSKTEGSAYPGKGGNDGIISPITPVNEMTTAFTQAFTINEKLENLPNKFEGKPISLLESYTFNTEQPSHSSEWGAAGETITNVNTPDDPAGGEIKA